MFDQAQKQLQDLIATYQELSEKEKFGLAKIFQDATGGKLSPFNSPSPVCVGLVPVKGQDGQIGFLGVRRAIPPCVGGVALAGGFLGTNEDPVAGMVREVLEETGVALNPTAIEPASLPKMGHNNNLLIFLRSSEVVPFDEFMMANRNLSAATDGEASELVLITPQTELCFPLHQDAVNQAFERMGVSPGVAPAKSFKP